MQRKGGRGRLGTEKRRECKEELGERLGNAEERGQRKVRDRDRKIKQRRVRRNIRKCKGKGAEEGMGQKQEEKAKRGRKKYWEMQRKGDRGR